MNWFEQVDKHKRLYGLLIFAGFLLINNSINATSVWMENNRDGSPGIELWEPFVWEYSSAVSNILIAPLLLWFFNRHPLQLTQIKRQILTHGLATVVYSLMHVVIMVMFREWAYAFTEQSYEFGPWVRELWYEYRKDAWGYVFFLFIYQMIQFIYVRLKGEANLIAESESESEPDLRSQALIPEHFLVKKLDREFLIKVSDIEWIESAGNYVNLHSNGRIYPLRSTLAQITKRLAPVGFTRIHRSHVINHHAIDNISYLASGDGLIELKSGQKLNLSRRYKENLKEALS